MVQHGIEELSYLEYSEATKSKGDFSMTLKTGSESYEYKIDEPFVFSVLMKHLGSPLKKGLVSYELRWDKAQVIEKSTIEIVDGVGVIPVISKNPGFISVSCEFVIEGSESLKHACGAAISPELIEPSLAIPEDFDQFWDEQKAALAKISIETSWTPINHSSHPYLHDYSHKDLLARDISNVEIDDVKVASIERDLTGIYTRPKNRKAKKHPAMLCVQGAGVMPTRPHNFVEQAEKGILVYEMGVHGISNLEKESYYQNLINGALKGYMNFNHDDRNKFYFRAVFLGVKRGLDFLMAQPEWDGETIVIRGSSQGGGQCMAGAYLEPRVSMISARVPALCDHTGFLKGRSVGGGKFVAFDEKGEPNQATLTCSRYFDGVNFMRKLNCAGSFSVGLLDGSCSPSSIYAAYNVFKGKKSMQLQPYTGHANTPEVLKKMDDEIDRFALKNTKL